MFDYLMMFLIGLVVKIPHMKVIETVPGNLFRKINIFPSKMDCRGLYVLENKFWAKKLFL